MFKLVIADTLKVEKNDFLKLIAVVTMFIDHIGAVMLSLPGSSITYSVAEFMRIIGRIAFPIFAYQLCIGYVNTSNIFKYFMRLVVFAFVSQVPFIIFYNLSFIGTFAPTGISYYFSNLNIFFTLILGLFTLSVYDIIKGKNYNGFLTVIFQFIIIACICITADLLKTDYNSYGILMIFLYYSSRFTPLFALISQIILTVFFYGGSIQQYCILSFFIIYLPFLFKRIKYPIVRLPKMFFYIFYPTHILLIILIRIFVL